MHSIGNGSYLEFILFRVHGLSLLDTRGNIAGATIINCMLMLLFLPCNHA